MKSKFEKSLVNIVEKNPVEELRSQGRYLEAIQLVEQDSGGGYFGFRKAHGLGLYEEGLSSYLQQGKHEEFQELVSRWEQANPEDWKPLWRLIRKISR